MKKLDAIIIGGVMINAFGYPAEYSDGGHGYGRRILGRATDTWSYEAAHWLAKFLK